MSTTTETQDYVFDNAVVTYEVKTVVTHTSKNVKNTLPKLPYEIWQQVVAFMKHIANGQNTEAIVSLTLIEGAWRVICWHQTPEGALHVDFKEGSDENQELLSDEEKEALLKVHCTVHSHNKANAFQSSDDADDELGKEGWHITVGNCDKDVISTHCRLNCKRIAEFDKKGKKTQAGWQVFAVCPISEVIESPKVPKKYRRFMKDPRVLFHTNSSVPYPEEWNERAKKKVHIYQPPHKGNYPTSRTTTTTKPMSNGHRQWQESQKKEKCEIITSIIDIKFPFEGPARTSEPEWVLAQEIWNIYKNKDLIKDVTEYDYSIGTALGKHVQEALENTETYFIVEVGKDPEMVGISLPPDSDVIDFLHDELPEVKFKTPINTAQRLKDKVLIKALYDNFKTQSIFGSMSI